MIKRKNSNNYSACGKLYYSNSGCRKNVENNTYQICRNDIFIDWYQLNCKKIISEIKDDGCYIAVNLGDWLKEQDIYDISVTEDNESEGYKEMYYERNPEKRKG